MIDLLGSDCFGSSNGGCARCTLYIDYLEVLTRDSCIFSVYRHL